MNKLIYITFSVLLFCACQTDTVPSFPDEEIEGVQKEIRDKPVVEEERPFELYYQQFIMSLASGDPASFKGLVHPEFGSYLIEAEGALPSIASITDIAMVLRKVSERSVLDFNNVFVSAPLIEDTLPTVDCDSPDGFYSKQGTFVADVNTLSEQQIWKYVGLDEAEQESIAKLADTINKTIVNTTGFTAYFSKIGDDWYLTFLDIRVPCTA